MDKKIKTTPLNPWHRKHGANMAEFGGFDMPLWYDTGVKKEHISVIASAGLFDTSHMACVTVTQNDALRLLQSCHTRDLSSLKDGKCAYGAILNEKGHVIDDAIVYRFSRTEYMVCVNAGMGGTVAGHLEKNKKGMAVEICDLSNQVGKIDLQGKNSAVILAKLIKDPEAVFKDMVYFSFKGHFDASHACASQVKLKDNSPVLVSRSGYTGEFGFELFVLPDQVLSLWNSLLDAGRENQLIPCGLGARDSLRAGALLPLSHQDIGQWPFINHPWEFALSFNLDKTGFTKEFIGKDVLVKAMQSSHGDYTYPFAGENLRKITAGPASQVIDKNGEAIGRVLTCTTDMAIGWHKGRILSIASPDLPENFTARGISCGFVLVNQPLQSGDQLTLKEKKRTINVTIVDDIRPDRTARQKITRFFEFCRS